MKAVILSFLAGFVGVSNIACARTLESEQLPAARAVAETMPGEFISIGNHVVSGSVQIARMPEGVYLVLMNDFMSSSGPDLRLVLRDSTGQTPMQIVAPLQQFQGAQQYRLEIDGQTLSQFDEVVVYCAKFSVDFGIAKLR